MLNYKPWPYDSWSNLGPNSGNPDVQNPGPGARCGFAAARGWRVARAAALTPARACRVAETLPNNVTPEVDAVEASLTAQQQAQVSAMLAQQAQQREQQQAQVAAQKAQVSAPACRAARPREARAPR